MLLGIDLSKFQTAQWAQLPYLSFFFGSFCVHIIGPKASPTQSHSEARFPGRPRSIPPQSHSPESLAKGCLRTMYQNYVLGHVLYELQPKFRLMESSIRDIFIFLKLSRGLENDNTLFKKTITFACIPKSENDNTLFKIHDLELPNIDRGSHDN